MNVAVEALPPQFVGSPVGDTAKVQVAAPGEPEMVVLPGSVVCVNAPPQKRESTAKLHSNESPAIMARSTKRWSEGRTRLGRCKKMRRVGGTYGSRRLPCIAKKGWCQH